MLSRAPNQDRKSETADRLSPQGYAIRLEHSQDPRIENAQQFRLTFSCFDRWLLPERILSGAKMRAYGRIRSPVICDAAAWAFGFCFHVFEHETTSLSNTILQHYHYQTQDFTTPPKPWQQRLSPLPNRRTSRPLNQDFQASEAVQLKDSWPTRHMPCSPSMMPI